MRQWLISTLVFLCVLLDRSAAQAQADPVNEIIQRVNALRAAYGVPAYQVDPALMYAAQTQASWGLENLHFGHDGPGGSMPDDRARAAGYGSGENIFAIENVAAGTASLNTPELVVTMWQGDWGHLNAMISADYEHIGVGFAEANDFSYYVMMVGWVGTKASSRDIQDQEVPIINPVVDTSNGSIVASEPDESGAIYHEVQSGQSAWTIAARYGIELAELFELNNLTEYSILHPGDVLMIRSPDPPTSTPTSTLTSKPTSIRSTEVPTQTPTPVQEVDVSSESDTSTDQNREDVSNSTARSNVYTLSLVVAVGLAVLVSVILFSRLRKP